MQQEFDAGTAADGPPFVAAAQAAGLSLTLAQLQLLSAAQDAVFRVARAQGQPVAWLLGQSLHDELEIFDIVVAAPWRRQGLGRSLLQHAATSLVPPPRRLLVEVAQDNVAALALYRASGFEQVGRRRGYYPRARGAAVDALVLAWTPAGTLL